MQNRDSYFVKLEEILQSVEQIYGLNEVNELNLAVNKLDITDILSITQQNVKNKKSEEIYKMNEEVGKQIILLSFLMQRLQFFKKLELSFSNYPLMSEIIEILSLFLSHDTISEDAIRKLNRIVAIIETIDKKYIKFRFALGYRYVRIFIIMILYKNYINASIVASLIISQVAIAEQKK